MSTPSRRTADATHPCPRLSNGGLDRVAGHPSASDAIEAIATVAFQGFYAGTRALAGWTMLGFDPGPTGAAGETYDEGTPLPRVAAEYNVIIVGAGAGGARDRWTTSASRSSPLYRASAPWR